MLPAASSASSAYSPRVSTVYTHSRQCGCPVPPPGGKESNTPLLHNAARSSPGAAPLRSAHTAVAGHFPPKKSTTHQSTAPARPLALTRIRGAAAADLIPRRGRPSPAARLPSGDPPAPARPYIYPARAAARAGASASQFSRSSTLGPSVPAVMRLWALGRQGQMKTPFCAASRKANPLTRAGKKRGGSGGFGVFAVS